jgi:hypothetical protein
MQNAEEAEEVTQNVFVEVFRFREFFFRSFLHWTKFGRIKMEK